jgi:hypothetical protein
MLDRTKFLAVALNMGKISEETRRFALNNQRHRRQLGEPDVKVGEILVQAGILRDSARNDVLERQGQLRSQSFAAVRKFVPNPPSTRGLRALVALLALLGVGVATFVFAVRLEVAVAAAGLLTYVVEAIIEYKAGRSIPLSLLRAAFPLLMLIVISLVLFAAVSMVRLDNVIALHLKLNPQIQTQVQAWLSKIKLAFAAMAAALSILFLYAIWKFHSLRFAESRLGATKDILIRVESILSDHTKSLDERQRHAITVVLKGLRNVIRLSVADRIMRWMFFFRPSVNQARALYFVPAPSGDFFELRAGTYPERAPESVREAFDWIRDNHHPRALNEPEFEKLKQLAKGTNPKGWKERYRILADRNEHISVCGWIYDKQETLVAMNASQCLAFDNRFLDRVREHVSKEVMPWLKVESFVGCPIIGKDSRLAGVLLVIKNIRNGFAPEDLEVVITASQILGRISQTS